MSNKNIDYVQDTANEIIESLKNGTAPWIKPWDANKLADYMPHNPVTNKPYNGINSIKLMLKQYDDPRWMTYKQAQSVGAQVKKGEKSTLIEYWQYEKEIDKIDSDGNAIKDELGKPIKETIKLAKPNIFYAYVFNASQIDGLEPYVAKELDEFKVNAKAQAMLDNSGASIKHNGTSAYYQPSSDSITLPPKDVFRSESAYYATALHELGHWSGHESRLNRDLSHPYGSIGYAKEELRAEIASFLLNGELGLGHDPSQHMSYIDSWVSILEDKPTEIFRATSDATKIVSYVKGLEMEQKIEQEALIDKQNEIIEDKIRAKELEPAGKDGIQITAGDKLEQVDDIDRIIDEKNSELEQAIAAKETIEYTSEQTYLYVPYEQKDEAKKLGAKWDKDQKMWFAPEGSNIDDFSRWRLPREPEQNMDYKAEFKEALESAGLIIDGEPIMDGKLHRVAVDTDKGRQLSGAYVGYENGHPAGYIENFKSGYQEKWKSSSPNREHSAQAAQALEDRVKINQLEREKRSLELEKAYETTAIKLQNEYDDADFAKKDHPYLVEKGVEASTGVKQDRYGNLLIPLRDIDGKQWSSQRIFSNGDKMIGAMRTKEEKANNIEYPSKKQGNFYLIGADKLDENVKEVLVCEGYATAMSVHKAMDKPTIMAVDAGNLDIVITSIKEKYPKMQISIAADNDIKRELAGHKNVGKSNAINIAKKHPDVKVALPKFTKEEVARGFSDFNDLVKSRGLEEVKRQLKEQIAKNLNSERAVSIDKKVQDRDKAPIQAQSRKNQTSKDIGMSV